MLEFPSTQQKTLASSKVDTSSRLNLLKNRQMEGFFNNTPRDLVLRDLNNESRRFSLISSAWVDWKNFTLHQAAPSHNPRLISNGDCIKCRGYIMGTWIEKNLSGQWTGIPIFMSMLFLRNVDQKNPITSL